MYSDEADKHSEIRYGMIRKSTTDIENIAKNTGYSIAQVRAVKRYLFIDKHELENGYERFEPDFSIGESWWRLAFLPDEIKDFDLMLLEHELYELRLVLDGMSQMEAHYKANRDGHDYQSPSEAYYNSLSPNVPKNSGAILLAPSQEKTNEIKHIFNIEMEER